MRHRGVDSGGIGGDTLVLEPAAETLRSLDPLVLSLLVVAVGGVVVGVWWLVRWLRRPPGVRLRNLLESRDEVAVLLHPNPDPDAMACAMGVAEIASSVDTDATLQFPGEIRHQENRAFRTVLGLELERIEAASELVAEAVVLVDHNTPRGFTGAQIVEPVAVVDHHPGNGTGTEFTDVRSDYGSASTIVAAYFEELDVSPDGDETADEPALSTALATGLLYGIQSDTNHLTRGCSWAEFEACGYLYPGIDEDLLDRIANPQVSDDVLKTKARAITDRRIEGSFAVCDVESVTNVDAISQAADELLQLEGVTAVAVYGEYDGTIHVSGRSRDDRVHMGETLRHAVSDVPMANAGGHARMGGGQIPVDYLEAIETEDGRGRAVFDDRLFEAMSGSRR
ncbi:phosphoesterase RecJ domain protein [Natronococcus amylolyticus DSM 10524]|uniref:Phosphoesterase RecJ domain protein n=1 Tax=Natronococcus amylolyticus DSM 10524 TaxID=1227497 RepID=L9XF89_9EURY|nr:bifunctional oligoribonuclease/PAP phosphatase NrnA [Natronococcus amylolyticus]ELY60399.1 phosphoesterase RecJ domain protein [Natronococcus amylolyticus DSM 10524]